MLDRIPLTINNDFRHSVGMIDPQCSDGRLIITVYAGAADIVLRLARDEARALAQQILGLLTPALTEAA